MHDGLTVFASLDCVLSPGSLERYSIWYTRPSPLTVGTQFMS